MKKAESNIGSIVSSESSQSPIEVIDFVKLYQRKINRGVFLAILPGENKVVARGQDYLKVEEEARKKGYEKAVVTRIPTKSCIFAYA